MATPPAVIIFKLPIPPSINSLYDGGRNVARRFKSDGYKEWQKHAAYTLMGYRADKERWVNAAYSAPVAVTYRIGIFNDKRKRDIANREKALSDFLVDEKILTDDHLIHRLLMEWVDDVQEGLVEVIVSLL